MRPPAKHCHDLVPQEVKGRGGKQKASGPPGPSGLARKRISHRVPPPPLTPATSASPQGRRGATTASFVFFQLQAGHMGAGNSELYIGSSWYNVEATLPWCRIRWNLTCLILISPAHPTPPRPPDFNRMAWQLWVGCSSV